MAMEVGQRLIASFEVKEYPKIEYGGWISGRQDGFYLLRLPDEVLSTKTGFTHKLSWLVVSYEDRDLYEFRIFK